MQGCAARGQARTSVALTESGLLLSLSVSTYWQSKMLIMLWTTLG